MTMPSYFPLPSGTTDQRPEDPQAGYIRFNTTVGKIEVYNGLAWTDVIIPTLRRIKELDTLEDTVDPAALVILDQYVFDEELEISDFVTHRLSLQDLFESSTVQGFLQTSALGVLSATNLGGFGDLSYNSGDGVFSYQGVTDSEIWNVMGVEGPNLAYDASTGVYSFSADPVFDSVSTTDLYVDSVTFTGTGAINITSNNDLTFDALGQLSVKSPLHLPRYSQAELASLADVAAGAIAVCTDPLLGGERPVHFDGTTWRDFANGDIDIEDDF